MKPTKVEQIPVTGAKTGVGLAKAPPAPPFEPPTPPRPLGGGSGGGDVQADESLYLSVGRVNWPRTLGAYAGSWAAGSLVGWAAEGGPKGAVLGGLTSSAVWSASETIHQWRTLQKGVAIAFLTVSVGSFWWVLRYRL